MSNARKLNPPDPEKGAPAASANRDRSVPSPKNRTANNLPPITPTRNTPRPGWGAKAACLGRTELPWDEGGDRAPASIVEVCGSCPVREDCVIDALLLPQRPDPVVLWRAALTAEELERTRARAALNGLVVSSTVQRPGLQAVSDEVVRYMVRRFAEGVSRYSIARELNELYPNDRPVRGGPWTKDSVANALRWAPYALGLVERPDEDDVAAVEGDVAALAGTVAGLLDETAAALQEIGIEASAEDVAAYLQHLAGPSDDELAELEELGEADEEDEWRTT